MSQKLTGPLKADAPYLYFSTDLAEENNEDKPYVDEKRHVVNSEDAAGLYQASNGRANVLLDVREDGTWSTFEYELGYSEGANNDLSFQDYNMNYLAEDNSVHEKEGDVIIKQAVIMSGMLEHANEGHTSTSIIYKNGDEYHLRTHEKIDVEFVLDADGEYSLDTYNVYNEPEVTEELFSKKQLP